MPSDTLLSTAELLVLPQTAGAPAPVAKGFWVFNTRPTAHRLQHNDSFNTLYLELQFPIGTLASLNGTPLEANDSAFVTVDPLAGAYGFTISPSGLAFRTDNTPTATFSFAFYGDASIADGSEKYASPIGYFAALDIWREVTVDRWRVAGGSNPAGTDAVEAAVEATGDYVLAAPR